MPTQATTRKAKEDLREGYAPTTAAGEFVHEEMHHQKEGKHGAETRRQAVAIGLSKARRAGVPIGKAPRRSRRPGTGASEVSRRAGRSRRKARKTARNSTRTSARKRARASPRSRTRKTRSR
ncbi:MAG: transcription elongation factor [Thermoplasmatota archaeon]